MAAQPQIVSGLQAVRAASAVQKRHEALDAWPFPWFAAPLGSRHVFQAATIAAPAVSALNPPASDATLILQYQVPNNFRFNPRGLVLVYTGAGWTPGDGNVVFSVTVNTPVGLTAAAGIPFKDFGNVTVPLGSFARGPWPIEPGELSVLNSRDILRAVVTVNDTGVVTPGGSNYFSAIFVGWDWPEK